MEFMIEASLQAILKNGDLMETVKCFLNGRKGGPFKRRRHGDFIKWYEDGSIQEYAHYHNRRLHGVHKKWNGDVVLFERLYVMGELEDEKYINEDSITEEYIEG